MKKTTIALIAASLLVTITNAAKDVNTETTKYTDETRRLTGDIFTSTADGKKVSDRVEKKFDNYMDTVIWNDIHKMQTKHTKFLQVQPIAKDTIIVDSPLKRQKEEYAAMVEKLEKERIALLDQNTTIPALFAGGYCDIHDTLNISKSYEFARLDCQMNVGQGEYRNVEVFATFYPDYKREMIIALPVYATFESQNRASFNGVVMTDNKTSFNLASWVDNKRIAKMMGEGLLATNDITYNYVTGYMREKAASRRETKVDYVNTTAADGTTRTIPVTTTKVAPPQIKDYVIGAAVEIFSKLVSLFGKDYLYSQNPLFVVYPQRVYVEGVLTFDNEGLAKRFGRISADQEKRSLDNNREWEKQKESIIKQYDHSRSKSAIEGVGK